MGSVTASASGTEELTWEEGLKIIRRKEVGKPQDPNRARKESEADLGKAQRKQIRKSIAVMTNKMCKPVIWSIYWYMQVLAILIAQFTQSWGMYGLLNWIPSFFTQTYGVDMSQLAVFTVVPYVAQAAVGVLSGYIADKMISRGKENL